MGKTERLGLVTIGYRGLEQLTRKELEPLLEQFDPDETAVQWLLARICDLVRARRVVTHGLR